ncbi:hypothetical protein ABZ402_41675 [Streptomyces mirabilis]|uniref:hypothetical protein n=1 Tax=Streptomyces mirabilis TaxID=68239 RepID=UPI0033D8BE64
MVIGAGPYGLSMAAHLWAAGVPVRIFGELMGSWRHPMATGMFSKSTPAATDLSAPQEGGRLADFCRETGMEEVTELTPIPCETFVCTTGRGSPTGTSVRLMLRADAQVEVLVHAYRCAGANARSCGVR